MKAIRHGGELSRIKQKHPEAPDTWLDLSTGVNPNPYPWQDKVSPDNLINSTARLPEQHLVTTCRDAWVNYLGAANPDEWTLAAGSQAIINLLPQLFPEHGIYLPDPTYGEHVRVWQNANRLVTRFNPVDLQNIEFPHRQVVIITNPNNPNGYMYKPQELLDLADHLKSQDSILVIDEAFCDVTPELSLADQNLPSNVILMRSFGKFFGLAGLRIGTFRASPDLQDKLQTLLGPWSVNGPALSIATRAFEDTDWIAETRSSLRRDGKTLQGILTKAKLDITGATDLFCLIRSSHAEKVVHQLGQHGIHIRAFHENTGHLRFGLPANQDEFDRLKKAVIF